jgi:predicted DNA-binding transcriptional regulator AlpA
MQQSTPSVKSLLRFKQLQQVVPLSRSEIDRLVSLGQFPAPIKLGKRVIAWDSDLVQQYVRDKLGGPAAPRRVRPPARRTRTAGGTPS